MKKYKILYIDDDSFLTEMYGKKFKEAGFEIETWNRIPDGDWVGKVIEIKPDLISMDMLMPGMDGFEATKILKTDSRTKHIPIFGFDNLCQPEDINRILECGIVDYLCKAVMVPSETVNVFANYLNNPIDHKPGKYLGVGPINKKETAGNESSREIKLPPRFPNKTKNLVTIVATLFLFLAIADGWPYGFFTLLRFVVCASTIFLAWRSYVSTKTNWAWVFVFISILFNPLIPVHLPRDTWVIIDIIVGLFLTTSLFFFKIPNRQK